MRTSYLWIGLVVGTLLAFPCLTLGETAEQAFSKAEGLLSQGDLEGALAAYAIAVRADRENQEYQQHYALLRRVISLRQYLDQEKDPQRFEYIARALHSFYVEQGIHSEALTLNRQVHARLKTASSAMMLAETALAMKRDAEAVEVLRALDGSQATPSTRALLGVALARQGKLDDARQVAANVVLPEDAGPGLMYRVARLHAATGNPAGALGALTRCFESLPPSRSAGFKEHAGRCPDFAGLLATAGFAEVLRTESKVPESKCSGGSKCAGCPMRGGCPNSKGQ